MNIGEWLREKLVWSKIKISKIEDGSIIQFEGATNEELSDLAEKITKLFPGKRVVLLNGLDCLENFKIDWEKVEKNYGKKISPKKFVEELRKGGL